MHDWLLHALVLCLVLELHLGVLTSYYLRYRSPHLFYDPFTQNSTEQHMVKDAIDMAKFVVSTSNMSSSFHRRFNMTDLRTCLNSAVVSWHPQHQNAVPHPFPNGTVVAHVNAWDYYASLRRITLEDDFSQRDVVERSWVFIHECTHLIWNTADYAYVWEDKFATLHMRDKENNADSITRDIFNY